MNALHAPRVPGNDTGFGGFNARDFGATGDGVCEEAADRSWTKCSGTDDSAALQLAIDEAMRLGRALYLPAGVYMVNASLTVPLPNRRLPATNASVMRHQPWITEGLRMVGEGVSHFCHPLADLTVTFA